MSILTPSLNQAAWLRDNLRSVACQSYPNIEHIVMDGGSTDGTVNHLRETEGIHWQSESDRGQADAINKAFAMSTGEIIGWINSDDAYFDCGVIEDIVTFFKKHPDVDVAYGHALQIDGEGRAVQVLWVPPYDPNLLRTTNCIVQPATFLRRRALAEPMLDESFHFAMDYELWLRLQRAGYRFARIDRFTGIDRHQGERKSRTIKDVNESDLLRLSDMYDTRLGTEWENDRSSFYLRQRLRGALLVPRVRPPFAFSAPADMKRGLLRRQAATRRRDWPEELR